MPSRDSVSPQWRMVSQSDLLPMITATRGSGAFPMRERILPGQRASSLLRSCAGDSPMKKGIWVAVAVAIAVAGAWGYGALVRQENDDGRRVQLLAIAEEQRLDLSFSRSGRLVTRVPEEGEAVKAGSLVAR